MVCWSNQPEESILLPNIDANPVESSKSVDARSSPVIGVRVKGRISPGFRRIEAPSRICDLLGEALNGDLAAIADDDIGCPLARFVLGVDSPTIKTRTVLIEKLVGWGVANEQIADRILDSMPRLPLARRVFEFAPIDQLGPEFDVALSVGAPGVVMERIIGFSYALGEQTRADMSGVAGVCGECIARVLRDGGAWISTGCRGSRPRAQIRDGELLHVMSNSLLQRMEGGSNG